jgi:hypothetical protein
VVDTALHDGWHRAIETVALPAPKEIIVLDQTV